MVASKLIKTYVMRYISITKCQCTLLFDPWQLFANNDDSTDALFAGMEINASHQRQVDK